VKVLRHRLCDDAGNPVRYRHSPNIGGLLFAPPVLVIHYTAGKSAENAINWLCNPVSRASAHLVISASGEITQLVDLNRIAWHAGPSVWEGRERLNEWSIGIELDNPGRLNRAAHGWENRFGDPVSGHMVHVDAEGRGWHKFPEAQLAALYVASEAIIDAEPHIRLVLGHSDIAVPKGRKIDPGPAFDMASFRASLLERGRG
jgi:N-acetylmuramoyl-L-alanine amidase